MERDTQDAQNAGYKPCISTHTLTWSVTPFDRILFPSTSNFNSHAHVERDSAAIPFAPAITDFNSHAHVERDAAASVFPARLANFNSHAHVERDVWLINALFAS